jgi:4-hydroxy-tetrahydrodipicolinate synthase
VASPATLEIRKLRLMTAVKTPYREDGNVDISALDRIVEHQIANGVEGIIIGGTTGEGHLFTWEEHLMLIAHIKTKFMGRVAVVGNTGSNATAESVAATKKGFAYGMDASLLINPYYGKTSIEGIIRHIEAAMVFGPAIIYNVPSRTGQDMKPETLARLAGHENFVGVKECMGPERIKELSDMGMAVWSGNDDSCHQERHECGAMGVISVTANIVPGLMSQMMKEPSPEINEKLGPLYQWLFTEPNPIGVNTMLMQLGSCKPVFRLPYTARNLEARKEGIEVLNAVGLEHCLIGAPGLRELADDDIKYTISGD